MSTLEHQDKLDNKELLAKLLNSSLKKRRTKEKLIILLQHGAWQGIGAIISLVSLIVTIILTIYIFVLSQNQQMVNIDYDTMIVKTPQNSWKAYVLISNFGPAKSDKMKVSVNPLISTASIKSCSIESIIGEKSPVQAINITDNNGRCEVLYGEILPSQTAYLNMKIEFDPNTDKLLTNQLQGRSASRKIFGDFFHVTINGERLKVTSLMSHVSIQEDFRPTPSVEPATPTTQHP